MGGPYNYSRARAFPTHRGGGGVGGTCGGRDTGGGGGGSGEGPEVAGRRGAAGH